jgi:hypothetical protein
MTMYDLGKLNDEELELLERLLSKAAGEHDNVVVPTFRIVREFVDAAADANYVVER